MKYAFEMRSGAMIKIGPGFQQLGRGGSQTHRQHGDLISLLFFNKESRLKIPLLLMNTEY
jgi:hypothetical protein